MNTCKTCRWWGPNHLGHYDYADKVGLCCSPKTHHVVTRFKDDDECELRDKKSGNVLDDDEVGVVDGSGYFAAMYTGPDFGCVHYEPLAEDIPIRRRTKEEMRTHIEAELAKPQGDKIKAILDAFGGLDAFVECFNKESNDLAGQNRQG